MSGYVDLATAMLMAFTAWMTWMTRNDVKEVKGEMNGMKDALVASTAKASHLEGKAEGKAEAKLEEGKPK